MFPKNDSWKLGVLYFGIGLAVVGAGSPATARQFLPEDTGPQDGDGYADAAGVQVQTRGPVHEAFAGAVVYDPMPCPVVAKQPPDPIDEQPPDEQPDGENVQWIPVTGSGRRV